MTDCIMKRLILDLIAVLSLLTASLAAASCIYDAPGDRFFRTLWKSTPDPLGPYVTEEITLEFLCDGQVTIKNNDGVIIAYGPYAFDDAVAVFPDLTIVVDGVKITFMEAHRNGDTLFLLWRPDFMAYPFTTALNRLSSYE